MQELPKRVVVASMIVAGLVAVAAISDMVLGIPFSGEHTFMMDIMFLICAAIVGYMGWDAFREMK
ncbi:hypothetical protein KOR42_31060 [Thalassoglobus neptunius]|uniref:Uncharacterized protein n=1 Tax=Thalassoglobus neptunius TaxID=1938619 RepID=A0A5C5WNM6_9PLAN|nr:hypothetical protein [Thalassoglobus neptunius]TWT52238.1 hypothetical protein KOR42_31060 [Thalassoglobus neptunius]